MEKWNDIITCDKWKNDQVFVEQRLAALNPMSLQRVTADRGKILILWQNLGAQNGCNIFHIPIIVYRIVYKYL